MADPRRSQSVQQQSQQQQEQRHSPRKRKERQDQEETAATDFHQGQQFTNAKRHSSHPQSRALADCTNPRTHAHAHSHPQSCGEMAAESGSDRASVCAAAAPVGGARTRDWLLEPIFDLPPAEITERFEIDASRSLGAGQFGTVRRCTDRLTGQRMAVKSLRRERFAAAPELREEVQREVEAMMRAAGHASVVELRAVYEDAACVHLVMDLCTGGDLFDEVQRRGRFDEADAAAVFAQIASGVAFCHSRGVVHRDLKPENILLTRAETAGSSSSGGGCGGNGTNGNTGFCSCRERYIVGDGVRDSRVAACPVSCSCGSLQCSTFSVSTRTVSSCCRCCSSAVSAAPSFHPPQSVAPPPPSVKLADFGLAALLHLGPDGRPAPLRGMTGSPLYMAPEVLSGAEYGDRADVWSLGVILYVLLSGSPPFWGDTDAEVFSRAMSGHVDFSFAPWSDVSHEAKALVRWMLALDPAQRPSAHTVLAHPWLRRATPAAGSSSGSGIMNSRSQARQSTEPPAHTSAAGLLLQQTAAISVV